MNQSIKIIPFEKEHQSDIDAMMADIAQEFAAPVFSAQSKRIAEVYELPQNKFWVATNNVKVAGTIGLTKLANGNVALKSMFVDKMFRGQNVSKLLLDTLTGWAIQHDYSRIYLGTMEQFIAGQRFYEKNGFSKHKQEELPADFVVNPLDTIFYTRRIN